MKAFGIEIKKPSQQEMLGIGLIVLVFVIIAATLSDFIGIDPPHILAFAACVFAGGVLSVSGIQVSQGWRALVIIALVSSAVGFSALHAGRWVLDVIS